MLLQTYSDGDDWRTVEMVNDITVMGMTETVDM